MAAAHTEIRTSNVLAGELGALAPGIPGQQKLIFSGSSFCYHLSTRSQHDLYLRPGESCDRPKSVDLSDRVQCHRDLEIENIHRLASLCTRATLKRAQPALF